MFLSLFFDVSDDCQQQLSVLSYHEVVDQGVRVYVPAVGPVPFSFLLFPFRDGERPQPVDISEVHLLLSHRVNVLGAEHAIPVRRYPLVPDTLPPHPLMDIEELSEVMAFLQILDEGIGDADDVLAPSAFLYE